MDCFGLCLSGEFAICGYYTLVLETRFLRQSPFNINNILLISHKLSNVDTSLIQALLFALGFCHQNGGNLGPMITYNGKFQGMKMYNPNHSFYFTFCGLCMAEPQWNCFATRIQNTKIGEFRGLISETDTKYMYI